MVLVSPTALLLQPYITEIFKNHQQMLGMKHADFDSVFNSFIHVL